MEECPDCPFESTLVSIGNISIGPCPEVVDCDCEDGLTSFTVAFLNEDTDAESVTFYYNKRKTIEACEVGGDLSYSDEMVCTLSVDNKDRFRSKTYFTVEYANDTFADCEGYFDTSCSDDFLGEFGSECSDLVVTSWTDGDGGTCTGNVSFLEPEESDSSSHHHGHHKGKVVTKKKIDTAC